MPNAVRMYVQANAVFLASLLIAVFLMLLAMPLANFPWPPAPAAGHFSREYGAMVLQRYGQWTFLAPRWLNDLAYIRVLMGHDWWRWVTAHFMHFNLRHGLMNAAALVVLGYYFREDFSLRAWLGLMLTASLAISLGLYLWQPELLGYVGLSGVLHALLYAGLIRSWRHLPIPTTIALIVFVGRMVWEHSAGYDPHYLQGWMHGTVAPAAHFYGAIIGTVWGFVSLWLERRRAGAPAAA